MKPAPGPKKNFAKDMKTFERLPAKNREVSLLKDRAEKATGQERTALNQAIRAKAR